MICECGNHCWKPITKGYVVLVSPQDVSHLQHKWHASVGSRGDVYAARSVSAEGSRIKERLHNVVMGRPAGGRVDHRNLWGLDNRRSNLRPCTSLQNLLNRGEKRGKKIPFKGVYRHHTGKFYASIRLNGVRQHLGVFDTAREAHCAYVGASKVLHGEFSRAARFEVPAQPERAA